MDLKVSFNEEVVTYNNVLLFDDLVNEILNKHPLWIDLNFHYVDEEGDQIQVSNTSDLTAIEHPEQVTIILNAREDEEKIAKLKAKKLELQRKDLENKQRKIQEKLVALQEQIEQDKIVREKKINESQKQLLELEAALSATVNFKLQPQQDIQEQLQKSELIEKIREKESQLLALEDQRAFETQLRAMQQDIYQIFSHIYAQRVQQYASNYSQQKENKVKMNKLQKELETVKSQLQKLVQIDDTDKQQQITKLKEELSTVQEQLKQLQ